MQPEGKTKREYAWRSACLLCKAVSDFLYTLLVVILAILVGLFAYIVYIDETEMPRALVRLLERNLESQGATLSMSGIRIQPSGRITIEQPVFHSPDLQSEIARADKVSLRLNPALVLFGHARLDELRVVNGTVTTPAMLSRSGVPESLIDQIDFVAENTRSGWVINRSKFRFKGARATIKGIVDPSVLAPEDPERETVPLNERLIAFHKQARNLEDYLSQTTGLQASIVLNAPRNEPRFIRATASALSARWQDQAEADNIVLWLVSSDATPLAVDMQVDTLRGPESARAESVTLSARWSSFPDREEWLPEAVLCEARSTGQDIDYATNLAVRAFPEDLNRWQVDGHFQVADSAWRFSSHADLESQSGRVVLNGSPTSDMVELGISIAGKAIPELPPRLESFAIFEGHSRVEIQADFAESWKPSRTAAKLIGNRIKSLEAPFDRVIAEAEIIGKQVSVPNIWLRSGPQHGRMSMDFDLDTKRRRLLIDGLFHPNTVNGWVPELWWIELWDNFQFPEEGFYCLMDSEQIVKRPETLRLTGYALGKNLGLRGHEVEEIETRMHILQRYIDLYDLRLQRPEGYARGETQFSIAQDPRDQKNKLSGLWIDAESTADLSIGPDVLYELREDVADILEPYRYETPPYVRAVASSLRHKNAFNYDIDLIIEASEAISYHHFPLDSLSAEVRVSNDRVSVPVIEAELARGVVEADAEVRGESIDLNVELKEAHFGDTLKASAIYFAANDEESAANEFSPEELSGYGGIASLGFKGTGIVGDALSFDGEGTYRISGADFYQLQLFGGLSRLFDNAGLPITTLRFEDADGAFTVDKRYVRFPEVRLKGRVAQIRSEGNYDLEEGELDFTAQLQPFRSIPLVELPARLLDIFTGIFEVQLSGTIADPKWSLFRGSQRRETPPAEPSQSGRN